VVSRLERSRGLSIAHGLLEVEVGTATPTITVRRAGRTVIRDARPRIQASRGDDRFIHMTEGVIPAEQRGPDLAVTQTHLERVDGRAVALGCELEGGRAVNVAVAIPEEERVSLKFEAHGVGDEQLRLGLAWSPSDAERLTGLGARHGESFDQRGRVVVLGADRRYTGPDCPPEMLADGGIPQGDCAPSPWLLSSAGWGLWAETFGAGTEFDLAPGVAASARAAAGPLRLHVLTDATPAARLRHYLRLTGLPALLAEWAYGHWKSRDVYEHERDVVDDLTGYLDNSLPLDAIVIDSPWETQYNTWRFNPHQFPDPKGLIDRLRGSGVRTVVWVTPWVNTESVDGQRAPGIESERLLSKPADNYAEGAVAGHFVRAGDGRPWVGRWWMGTGSLVDFTSPAASRWWRRQARRILDLGVEGIKADDGEGYYLPPDARLADGRTGAEAGWAYGELYRRTMQRALDESHPGSGVLFGRSGWAGQQSIGITWGGDQASDFWSLRALIAATLTAAASGFSNWSHDVGGYLGRRLVERCPRELLLRWVQFGCFTPLMHAHSRFEQEAWRYDEATLDAYRAYVLLHEQLVPYIRAAAASASRCGLPIIRPLCLVDPSDPCGWEIPDAYFFGPALWVAPVLEEGATERTAYLPRGEWIDAWSGEQLAGGREVTAEAPPERIPIWVRRGALVVTHPADHVAHGLGFVAEGERPLEATLWGRPTSGRAQAKLADGTTARWHRGRWSVEPPRRNVTFVER
jgi:alpha-glucosidase (family GH31 glycosyl hydrolase)